MLHWRDVSKRFGDSLAVDDISFDLADGICALLGPNGADKSTPAEDPVRPVPSGLRSFARRHCCR
jgi:ABC-type lipopolysaccharide export system ATPase subunit